MTFCLSSNGYDKAEYFKVVLGEHHQIQNSGVEVEREVVEIIKV